MEPVFNEEEEIAKLQKQVDNAMAMKRLQENEDFKKIFNKGFIEDWAITQTYNVSAYTPQSRVGVMEQMLARSIFSQYCDNLIEDGRTAKEALQSIKEEESDKE